MVAPEKSKLAFIAAAILLVVVGGIAAFWNYATLVRWLTSSDQATTILVSGNIEAHQSLLGFKTVQSRVLSAQ